jgi:hypothetical protein
MDIAVVIKYSLPAVNELGELKTAFILSVSSPEIEGRSDQVSFTQSRLHIYF